MKRLHFLCLALCMAFLLAPAPLLAQDADPTLSQDAPLRRPISPEQPMWLIHIDTWNYPDPQKIIDMVPEDIRPYVVFNISLSASKNVCSDGYAVCDSWLKTCAQNRVWTMVQCASGAHSNFSDFDLSIYEDYFRKYPNFIGWNFAEQFWGFGDEGCPTFLERLSLFGDILKMCQHYGGYLVVSFTQAVYSADMMPIAYMKRNAEVNRILTEDPEHFICCEKYTMSSCFLDIESNCLGAYLGGYAGQYGIRFDGCGWHEDEVPFVKAAGAIPILEHVLLTGETVIDGPELIWTEDSRELKSTTTPDGYTRRNWDWFPHFRNINIDGFRKILDGTIRIMSRKEVIDRTKICVVNDSHNGTNDDYMAPETMLDGLYRSPEDAGGMQWPNHWLENRWWLKTSGRYPTFPQVYGLLDADAKQLTAVLKSQYDRRWKTVADKVKEMNTLFPEEYTGDIFAGRHENAWMTYNPYQYDEVVVGTERTSKKSTRRAQGNIPFKYNTCASIDMDYAPYSLGIMREEANTVRLYLNNYQNTKVTEWGKDDAYPEDAPVTDVFRIQGASSEPVVTWNDRGNHQPSQVKTSWADGICQIEVQHNGPLEVNIDCAGQGTDRLTQVTPAKLVAPVSAPVYMGARQYEAEFFDYKNITECYNNGYNRGHDGYQGQGFMNFGSKTNAMIRDTIQVPRTGSYKLTTRYIAPNGNASVNILVDGRSKSVPTLSKCSTWSENTRAIQLTAGTHSLALRFGNTANQLYLDCFKLEYAGDANAYDFENDAAGTEATTPAAEGIEVLSGEAGVVTYTTDLGKSGQALQGYSAAGCVQLTFVTDDAANYNMVWTQVQGASALLLRAQQPEAGGLPQGYLFECQEGTLRIVRQSASGREVLDAQTLPTLLSGIAPLHLRALAQGDNLTFEASADATTWTSVAQATDATFRKGRTYLVWNEAQTQVDDILFRPSSLTLSVNHLNDMSTELGDDASAPKTFTLSGDALLHAVTLSLPAGSAFELSTQAEESYGPSLELQPSAQGALALTTIYVRLKKGYALGSYEDSIRIESAPLATRFIGVDGNVLPKTYSIMYDFEDDAVRTTASTPPAKDVTVGTLNSATAGVVSKADAAGLTSNMLKAYSASSRNGTGVLNLKRFTNFSTDYSVTWRQVLGSTTASYKNGVLLRGNTQKVGTASLGYTQGMMNGYYCCVYVNGSTMEFRVYKATQSASLTMIQSRGIDMTLTALQSMWYRASVSGQTAPVITLEYSTDGSNWQMGTSVTDGQAQFLQGATQFVWGLAASTNNFFIDDLCYEGITYDPDITAIEQVVGDGHGEVIREEYYSLSGQRIAPTALPAGQVMVRRCIYADGTVETHKVVQE